jgi:hypothetical protein
LGLLADWITCNFSNI